MSIELTFCLSLFLNESLRMGLMLFGRVTSDSRLIVAANVFGN